MELMGSAFRAPQVRGVLHRQVEGSHGPIRACVNAARGLLGLGLHGFGYRV